MKFHREAFLSILERSGFESNASFAHTVPMSVGALHDITSVDPFTGRTRRQPSSALIKKLATALKVPVTAIIKDPESVESEVASRRAS